MDRRRHESARSSRTPDALLQWRHRANNSHAYVFADPVIHVDDLLKDRERLGGAMAAIV
jgi:hypothetical protein